MTREATLTRTFVEMADTLVADFDVTDLLTSLAERCVEILDVDAAGVMLADADRQLRLIGSSSEAMRVLELFELEAEEGPCVDAFRTGAPAINIDLEAVKSRWPTFSAEALAAGFRAADALPLRLHGAVIGALNLFRNNIGEMDEADVKVAQALADIATIAILQHRAAREADVVNSQLQHALDSRVVIEQAKGMIAERMQLDMEQAFSAMRGYARSHSRRLGDVARDVIAGALPPASLEESRSR